MLYDSKWDAQVLSDLFLTARRLDISEKARSALVTVLAMMERGEIHHSAEGDDARILFNGDLPPQLVGIQMSRVWTKNDCGTAGCLLGWVRWVGKDTKLLQSEECSAEILDLFCMGNYHGHKSIGRLTSSDVAPALRSWLTTGKVVWPR
jgi:hypothetical protein